MIVYGLAFLSGILGSFHCIGMCSGFPILISSTNVTNRIEHTLRQLLYNTGRIFTYFFLGALVGYLGLFVSGMKQLLSIQIAISIIIGLIIIYIGLQIMGLFKEGRIAGFAPIYGVLKNMMTAFIRQKGIFAPFLLGLLNGFLPCPLIYGFLLVSFSRGNPLEGAFLMMSLGLGTIPAMFLVAMIYRKLSPVLRFNLSRLIPGALMVTFGIITIVRAIIPHNFGETIHNICGYF